VVRVLDYFSENNTAYIVMEYIRGVSLEAWLKSHQLRQNQALALIRPVVDALVLLHQQGVVHRDLKPDNIILQVIACIVVSIAVTLTVRPIAVKYFNKDRTRTNIESMIGKQGVVIDEIDNLQGFGQITVGGMEWSARNIVQEEKIPVGAVVIIRAVDGVKLLVEAEEQPSKED
jgi:serine/threonine protein kinase